MMAEFKEAVTRILTPHASAILLDPEYGLSAAKVRSKNAGLLLAYEKSGYDNTQPGRLPDLLDHYSVRRLVAAGADCVKILLYYTPFDPPAINETKHAWVERIGGECAAADVPFFLEFVGYDESADEKGIEFARKKPEIVAKQHGGIFQAAVRRGRAEGGSAGEHGLREGRARLQGRIGLLARGGQGAFPARRCRGQKAVHLSFRRRQQRNVQRDSGTGRRSRTRISPAFSAGAPPGKTAFPSTPSRASRRSRIGSAIRAWPISRT